MDAGKPRVWLNFDKPFAELPPVFMPPRPELVRAWAACLDVCLDCFAQLTARPAYTGPFLFGRQHPNLCPPAHLCAASLTALCRA